MAIIKGQPTTGDDDIVADGADDTIDALAGNDRVDGGGGNDTLFGNTGTDVLIGGTGNNTLDGGEGNDQVVESGNVNFTLTNDKLTGIGMDRLISIEGATLIGGAGNNTIDTTKFTGPVTLFGGVGDDRLLGGDGNDTLFGELGGFGGSGNDILDGGDGNDRVIELSDVNFTLTNDQLIGNGTDRLISIEGAGLTGGSSNNILDASKFTGSVALTGNLGNDTLIAGTSNSDRVIETGNFNYTLTNDSLTGEGTDRLTGIETASLVGGTGNNIIDASRFTGSVILAGGGPNDAPSGNDILTGGSSNDILNGGDGNDVLISGRGSDQLTGGAGRDLFRFNFPKEGVDLISDFAQLPFPVRLNDSIQVRATGFGGGLTAGSVISAEQFRLGSSAADADDRFIYNDNNGALSFDVDGVGGASQVQIATLVGAPTLTNIGIAVI